MHHITVFVLFLSQPLALSQGSRLPLKLQQNLSRRSCLENQHPSCSVDADMKNKAAQIHSTITDPENNSVQTQCTICWSGNRVGELEGTSLSQARHLALLQPDSAHSHGGCAPIRHHCSVMQICQNDNRINLIWSRKCVIKISPTIRIS